ncbi:MAG: class I SAM-dependent methyltransferase [Candidatus Hydrogenedentes bacterium]|nr:class I SAM-dependent methyltransferase [Candidatus Hydrogenedentota bacterium]
MDFGEKLVAYDKMIGDWNRLLSLVARGDVTSLWERHILDSLSLVEWIVRLKGGECHLLDIGSGGGFPAVPVKLALPGLRLTMVERSARKVVFLRKVIAALKLGWTEVVQGEFPRAVAGVAPDAVTARAVEKPRRVVMHLVEFLPVGSVFLCQLSDPNAFEEGGFHVEPVKDVWSEKGWRRGRLFVVTRRAARARVSD